MQYQCGTNEKVSVFEQVHMFLRIQAGLMSCTEKYRYRLSLRTTFFDSEPDRDTDS